MFPKTRTVLDMGGQDTKAIRIELGGEVLDFCMNDKCAAGTGRFLQSAAAALGLELPELGPTALRGRKPVEISTTCTVFAESEVGLLRRVGIENEITFTGGVARNEAMVSVMNEVLGFDTNVSEESHFIGALGAALFALERAQVADEAPVRKAVGEG
jgi:activator of 2-hydroxyglutaryl-CoA dehydratase